MPFQRITLSVLLLFCLSPSTFAQAPAARTTTGTFGAGFAFTGGNTDTSNLNLALALIRDLKTKNVMKANVSYLRGSQNGVLNLNRTTINLRDEFTFSGRAFVFGQTDYAQDEFKQIVSLWAPSGGLGFKVLNSDRTVLTVDGGAGGFLEKNPGRLAQKSGSVTTGQRLQVKLSSTSTFTQSIGTIFKANDFADSLTNQSIALTTALVKNLQLKVEFIDSYKNKPPRASIKKNDLAFVTALVVKF